MTFAAPLTPVDQPPERDEILARARALAADFATDAALRDQAGGAPHAQIAALKRSGLLRTMIARDWGGHGQPWSVALEIVRLFATTDGSLAHLFGYHFSVLHASWLAGDPVLTERLHRRTAAGDLFWGNAVSALSHTLKGHPGKGGHVLNGFRPFCSGSHVADILKIGWEDAETGQSLYAAIPADRAGLEIVGDWDGIGQTQTGSGTVRFHDLRVEADEVIDFGGTSGRMISTLIPLVNQSVLSNVFVGSAFGAIAEARDYTLSKSRPWVNSGVEEHRQDPWIQRVYGEMWIRSEAAALLVDQGNRGLDDIWAQGLALGPEARGEAARKIAAGNVLAGEVALEVTSRIFEVMGARSATRANGFDRFWRNVRIHTLHNPAEYKARSLGQWVLDGRYPEPGPFR